MPIDTLQAHTKVSHTVGINFILHRRHNLPHLMGFGLCVVVLVLVLHAVRLLLILFQLAFRPRGGFGLAVDWLRTLCLRVQPEP